jgi:hypothetical protein
MNSSVKRLAAIAAAVVLGGLAAPAKPNLSGEWKLSTAKSEFGQMPAPSSMVQKMTHDEPSLKVSVKQSSDMGEFAFDAAYTTDGKESTNTMMDNPTKSVVTWDGDTLLIETKGKFGDSEFKMNDKWTVSPDGKVLTINRHFSSSFGEGDQKMVLEKQ